MIKKLSLAAAAVAATVVGVATANTPAISAELKFASFVGGRHVMNRKVFAPWAKQVAKLSGGGLKITMHYGGALGKGPAKQYKRAIDGVADITWGLQGYTSKQFRRTTMIEMPEVGADAVDTTRRMWKVYDRYLAPEYSRVKVIAIWALDQSIIHTKKKQIRRIGDLRGMKIRTPSQIQAKLIGALGATPLAMPVTKVYNSLDRGVIDGVLISNSAINNFKLNEVTRFHTRGIPWGRSPFFAVMNKKSYNALSKAHRDIIDKTTGRALSIKASRIYTEDGAKGLKRLMADSKRTVNTLSASEVAKAIGLLKKAEAKIVSNLKKKEGVDAAGVLAALRGAGG